jgi:hypothetical protein
LGRRNAQPGQVLGTAGGGLIDAEWAANADVARIGRTGELRTAEVLDRLARERGWTVLHDLRIPIPGFTANIDHAVVADDTLLLIDSKVWKPGWYWTFAGVARRGWSRFAHAETKTPAMAFDSIGRYLAGRGVDVRQLDPIVCVWPSSTGRLSLTLLRMERAWPIRAEKLARIIARALPRRPARPEVVRALSELLPSSGIPRQARGERR